MSAERPIEELEVARPEPASDEESLPAALFDAPGIRAASAVARENIDRVVLRPGTRGDESNAGLYLDVHDLSHRVRVSVGSVVPEDLYLISEQYLLREPARSRALEG